MSIDLEYEEVGGFRVRLALHILTNIVPKLMDNSVFISTRIAYAYTWYRFLCISGSGLCPKDIPDKIDGWGFDEIKKIADALVMYARKLLASTV